MKIVKITTAYDTYLKQFYFKNPGLEKKSYAEQKEKIDYDGFGWADFWENALEPLGYHVVELLTNAKPMQNSWACENGVLVNEANWLLKITESQILAEKPDILFVDDYSTFSFEWLTGLRQVCPSIKLILGWCGAPFRDTSVFKAYDVVLSCIPELVTQFREMGHKGEHLHHAFEPRILERIDLDSEPYIDFSFIGQVNRGNQYHLERERILEELVSKVNVKIFTPSVEYGIRTGLKNFVIRYMYDLAVVLKSLGLSEQHLESIPVLGKVVAWDKKPHNLVSPILKPYMNPGVYGLNMYQTLRNSKVTFNSHINLSAQSASNMRIFEAVGVGTCLVTDWKPNLNELFDIDSEIVAYKSVDECIEKVRWLLDNPSKRKQISKAGQAKILKEHTFACRAVRLDEIIRKELR